MANSSGSSSEECSTTATAEIMPLMNTSERCRKSPSASRHNKGGPMIGLTVIRHDVTDSSRGWHGHGSSMASGKLIDSGLDTEKFTFFFVFVGCDGGAASAHIMLLGGSGRHGWLSYRGVDCCWTWSLQYATTRLHHH
mmetsp:Transcript_23233/g.33186  ORF Transcript_23233/g.33186 Transcript_23233/m.33186 type:complete len:138 (+) Transcript_23233:1461-1874(+)